jgi:hypothetical protein
VSQSGGSGILDFYRCANGHCVKQSGGIPAVRALRINLDSSRQANIAVWVGNVHSGPPLRIYRWSDSLTLFAQSDSLGVGIDGENFVPAAAADLDGDGRDELLVQHASDSRLYAFNWSDSGFLQPPWFAWNNMPFPGQAKVYADIDNDGVADIVMWGLAADSSIQVRIARGRKGTYPDTTNLMTWVAPFRHGSIYCIVGHVFSDTINDFGYVIRTAWGGKTISRAYFFDGLRRPLQPTDFDTGRAAAVIRDPYEFDSVNNNFLCWATKLLGNVNGTGQPSLVRTGSIDLGGGYKQWDAFLYSAGNALDTKFDGWIETLSGQVSDPTFGNIVDIGDVDGDAIDDFAMSNVWADSGSTSGAGMVYIVRGSGDFPHKPVRSSVAERAPDVPIRVQVWPSPASERATVQFQLASGEDAARVTLVDAIGRVIAVYRDFAGGGGWYTLPLDVRAFAAGTYRCVVTTGLATQQVVLQVLH